MRATIMTKLVLAACIVSAGLMGAVPAHADHVSVGIGIGGYGGRGYGGYHGGYYGRDYYGYPGYYPDYAGYYPYYAPPPTVVYAPAPQVVYAAPPEVAYVPAPVATAPAQAVNVNPSSATFTNGNGQTCREYQTNANVGGSKQQINGTACQQPEWHLAHRPVIIEVIILLITSTHPQAVDKGMRRVAAPLQH